MDSLFNVFRHGSPDNLVENKLGTKLLYYALWIIPWLAVSNIHHAGRAALYPEAGWIDFLILYFPYWVFWAFAARGIYTLLAYQANKGWSLLLSLLTHGVLIVMAAYLLGIYLIAGEVLLLSKPIGGWASTFLFSEDSLLYQQMNAAVYVIILGGALFIRQIRKEDFQAREASALRLKNAALENQLTETKLSVLQQQLQPHFLFNTLNTVASLIEKRENDLAYKVVGLLGGLLRTTLDLQDSTLVQLDEEVKYLKRYLDIEKIRFKDRLSIVYAIEPQASKTMVPALLLQPLVENTIKHAVARKAAVTHLLISAKTEGANLVIAVRDDGPGSTNKGKAGLGLANLKERLRVIYDGAAILETGGIKKGGFAVNITLPRAMERKK